MQVECPVCEFELRGHPSSGYRCVQCHARYTTRFVKRLRTFLIRERIRATFGPTDKPDDTIVLADDTEETLFEAHESIEEKVRNHWDGDPGVEPEDLSEEPIREETRSYLEWVNRPR